MGKTRDGTIQEFCVGAFLTQDVELKWKKNENNHVWERSTSSGLSCGS